MPGPPTDVTKRIKAARMLAGFASHRDLAAAIDRRGLGERTLRKFEAGEVEPDDWHLEAIARACGVPAEFFTLTDEQLNAAFRAASESEPELTREMARLKRRLAVIEERLRLPPQT